MKSSFRSYLISLILIFGIYSFYNVQPALATLPQCAPGDESSLRDSSDTSGTKFVSPDLDICGPYLTVNSACNKALGMLEKTGNECCASLNFDYCAGDITEINPLESTFHWYCCTTCVPDPSQTTCTPCTSANDSCMGTKTCTDNCGGRTYPTCTVQEELGPHWGDCTHKSANSCGASGGTQTGTYDCSTNTVTRDCNIGCDPCETCQSGTCIDDSNCLICEDELGGICTASTVCSDLGAYEGGGYGWPYCFNPPDPKPQCCLPIPPPPASCQVTTSPSVYNMLVGGKVTITASVTSGLGYSIINRMRFKSGNANIASVPAPAPHTPPDIDYTDRTLPYTALVTAYAIGNTSIKAEADLDDDGDGLIDRTCLTDATTDTNINVLLDGGGGGPTPIPIPTAPPAPCFLDHVDPCISPSNTCYTNNGTENWIYLKPKSPPTTPATYDFCASIPHPCTRINCSSGYTCLSTPGGEYDYTCTPAYSIRGSVFIDTNPNGRKDPGEMNYPGGILISSNPPLSLDPDGAKAGAGEFLFPTVFPVTPYTITYNNGNGAPWGYDMTTLSSFTVTVGSPCSVGTSNAVCDVSGNITELNFGISNSSQSWIQTTGSDLRWDSGFSKPIPANKYASVFGTGGMPGIIFSGAYTPSFGFGQASANPYNWKVGSTAYPDVFTATHSLIPTSYGFLIETVNGSGIAKKGITDLCSGGSDSTNCILTPGLANGVYWIDLGGSGNLNLNGTGPTPSYAFPAGTSATSKNFVILVNGNLNINEKITVPANSTVIFSAKGNITVSSSLGESSPSSTASNLEGLYSADKNFEAEGNNNCVIGADRRLNIAGSVIANAGRTNGTFINNRNLCGSNTTYPSVSFIERPDFILNYPSMVKQINRTWQDVAP